MGRANAKLDRSKCLSSSKQLYALSKEQCHYPHFTDGKTEARGRWLTAPDHTEGIKGNGRTLPVSLSASTLGFQPNVLGIQQILYELSYCFLNTAWGMHGRIHRSGLCLEADPPLWAALQQRVPLSGALIPETEIANVHGFWPLNVW